MVEQTGSNPSEGPSFELAQSNKAAPMAPGDAHVTVRELFQRANGHEPLAAYMGEFPESAIFRRFATLNARNILYYQAELAYLERILKEAAETDSQSGDSTLEQFGQWWFKLSHCDQFPCGSSEQWKIFLEIRRVLNDYNAALLQQLNLAKVHGPSRQALSLLNKWMKNPSRGNIRLFGEDSHIWTATTESELLALERRGCDDPLSSWITSFITNWFHRTIGKHINKPKPGDAIDTVCYSRRTISLFASVIVLSLSSLLPLLSIVVLNKVHNPSTRLWVIAGFTILFSTCLGLVTNVRRVEIFSAAAAYAAVQVVFIAGNPSGSSSP